jgi:CelD/BcsL family acetyltransferase involved in cellulose biosynthesis
MSSDLPIGSILSVITSYDQLLSLEAGWRSLEKSSQGETNVFQSFDWVSSWASVYAISDRHTEIIILAGFQESQLVFVWPLMKTTSWGIRSLVWLTEPSCQYGDILIDKRQPSQIWIDAALRMIKQLKHIDIVRLRHVRDDANISDFATSSFSDGHVTERAPFLDLSLYMDDAAYEARYSSTQRKRRKKIRKSLEDIGPVQFTSMPPGAMADKATAHAISEKNQWLKQRGRMNLILRCPLHLEFLRRLSRVANGEVEVVTTELTANSLPISWEIAFRYRNTHFAYITSHMNEHTDLSPGRLHMDMSQRKAIADGQSRFDLMVPYDAHKESWSSGMVGTNDYFLAMNLRGKLYGTVYLRYIRPLIRHIYYKLPQGFLKGLQRLAGY